MSSARSLERFSEIRVSFAVLGLSGDIWVDIGYHAREGGSTA